MLTAEYSGCLVVSLGVGDCKDLAKSFSAVDGVKVLYQSGLSTWNINWYIK